MATVIGLLLTGITRMSLFERPARTLRTLHSEPPAATVVVEPFDDAGGSGPTAQASRFLQMKSSANLSLLARAAILDRCF